MRYLVLIYTPEVDPASVPPEDYQSEMAAYAAFTEHSVYAATKAGLKHKTATAK